MRRLSTVFSAAILTAASLNASGERFVAGPTRVALVELFTSEGCSSCPPADRWLAALREDPRLWRDYVPVEFHVNYWNHLGWTDRLSSLAFTRRQYALAGSWGTNSVYTPCFVLNGAEWRPSGRTPGSTPGDPGTLRVEIADGSVCRVDFVPAAGAGAGPWSVHAAVLGGGMSSHVTAGENRGETLAHEFVALGLSNEDLEPGAEAHSARFALPATIATDAPRRALAVWVTRRGDLTPVQATGGWIAR